MTIHSKETGFGSVAIIAVIAIAALAGTFYLTSNNSSDGDVNDVSYKSDVDSDDEKTMTTEQEMDEQADGEKTMDDRDNSSAMNLPKEKLAVDVDTNISLSDEVLPVDAGSFEAYSPEKLAMAADGDVVLFFHAGWCPSCRGLENDIEANISAIPAGVHILQVDYDSETALKQKYGVVRQHTLVQVDTEGNAIKTLTGLTNTLDQVVSQI